MTDTARTLADLLSLYADNSTGDISAQDLRDLLASEWVYDADAQPTSAHANNDEFRSGSLGGSWTDWDPGSVCATTVGSYGLDLVNTASALKMAGVHRAVPVSSDWTITTKCSLQRDNTANHFAGIFLAEDLGSSPTTGDLRTLSTSYGGSGARLEVDSWNDYQTFNTNLSAFVEGDLINGMFLRIAKTSTTYRFLVSGGWDGVSWLTVYSTTSLGITPVKVGLHHATDRGNVVQSESYFRFWRQVDTANWWHPVLGRTP